MTSFNELNIVQRQAEIIRRQSEIIRRERASKVAAEARIARLEQQLADQQAMEDPLGMGEQPT